MKITMKYDQGIRKTEVVTLEVPEKELEKMVELDYQLRLESVECGELIEKRTPQEIIEEWNRCEYNSWQRQKRRQVSFQKMDDDGCEIDMTDTFADYSQEEDRKRQDEYEEICQKIRKILKPEQADMIIAICLDGMAVKDYSEKLDDKLDNVYKKLRRSKNKLKIIFKKRPISPSPVTYK